MKYLVSIILTLLMLIVLLFTSTQPSTKPFNKVVEVPYTHLNEKEKREVDCLADNIYHEAGYEPEDGKIAVAQVTINRVKSNLFEKSVCGVVHQRTKSTCQFTWLCEGKKKVANNNVYEESRAVALLVYFNHMVMDDLTKGAIYYHADYVSPGWTKLKKTTKIGRHIFYIDPKVKASYDGKTQYTS